jgi:hypothetical protein
MAGPPTPASSKTYPALADGPATALLQTALLQGDHERGRYRPILARNRTELYGTVQSAAAPAGAGRRIGSAIASSAMPPAIPSIVTTPRGQKM